jgi:protein TonB
MPELIGGLDSLQSRLIYPKLAIENKIEGKVYLLVIIDSTGNQNCANVIKGLGYGCDEEALYLINTSKFSPGLLRNKSITTILAIPVIFSLTNEE